MSDPPATPSTTGLLLTGGGARAAYQVGVLEAIADIRIECAARAQANPFPVITGTSAGAINAAVLACGADDFDKAVRTDAQSTSVAAAIHLGAQRILVVRAGRLHEPKLDAANAPPNKYPTLAQIAGHTLSNIFLDALAVDVERVRRINHTINLVPAEARAASGLRPIDLLVITPSERIDAVAAKHVDALPRPVRALLGGVGVTADKSDFRGAALASYLLFEAPYTQELMALGRADTLRQRSEVVGFFGWVDPGAALQSALDSAARPLVERRRDPLRLR